MRNRSDVPQIGSEATVFLSTVMEYVCAEILEAATEVVEQEKKKILKPRHIELGVRNDKDLQMYFRGQTFANAGLAPHIDPRISESKVI